MAELTWIDDEHLRLGDVDVRASMGPGASTSERLQLKKPRALVEAYVDLFESERPAHVVELGINQGGSTALFTHLAEPRKHVAVELSPDPVLPLQDLLGERGLTERVHTYYGIDQGDRERLTEIVGEEFGEQPLDLVIDDASHHAVPTRASFEVLFPRLRPGGLLLLEDWRWDYQMGGSLIRSLGDPQSPDHPWVRAGMLDLLRDPDHEMHDVNRRTFVDALDRPTATWHAVAVELAEELGPEAVAALRVDPPDAKSLHPDHDSLTPLVVELVMTAGFSPDIVAEVTINPWWVAVRRGPAPLDVDHFEVVNAYVDHLGLLVARD